MSLRDRGWVGKQASAHLHAVQTVAAEMQKATHGVSNLILLLLLDGAFSKHNPIKRGTAAIDGLIHQILGTALVEMIAPENQARPLPVKSQHEIVEDRIRRLHV